MKTTNELKKYFYRDTITKVDFLDTPDICNGRRIAFARNDMIAHGDRIPYEILEYSKMFLHVYLEDIQVGYAFIFTQEPADSIRNKIDIANVFEERGFWSVLTFGLANRTLKQTLADIEKFIRSDKNNTPECKIESVQIDSPAPTLEDTVLNNFIPRDWEQLDERPGPQYTFEQVKQLVTIIRGEMDDQLIKQLLELNLQ